MNAYLSSGELLFAPDVMQAINVAYVALQSDAPAERNAVPSWREGLAKATGTYTADPADDEW